MDFLGSVVNSNFPSGISASTTPAEKQLRPILCDDNIQILSSFELNQVASLTYNDVTCDGIFEFLQLICSRPLDHTPLTLQKTLIVTKHIVVYGSEKTVNHAYGLQACLRPLLEFNTVLMTQQQGGAMSFFQSLQGGAVDKGGPIREASEQLLRLLGNINELRRLRITSASEDSLVPVGDNGQVAFVTDEVRHTLLQRKMAEEQRIAIQSNLKKSQGGFGGGYASKDGRSVVGAAHGIEEMIKMANISNAKKGNKFSDDGIAMPREKTREELILEELKAEDDAEKARQKAAASSPNTSDFLGGNPYPAPDLASEGVADLLDFGGSSSNTTTANANTNSYTATTADLIGGGGLSSTSIMPAASDPFGLSSAYNTTTSAGAATASRIQLNPASSSLLDFSIQNDPFAPISALPNPPSLHNNDSTGLMGMTMNTMNNATMMQMQTPLQMQNNPGAMNNLASGMASVSMSGAAMASPPMPMAMTASSNADRFSALDALAGTAPATATTSQSARDAEARLLGFAAAPSPRMTMGTALPPSIPKPVINPGSGRVATAYGGSSSADEGNDDNPWMMGGATGMGLAAPSAPPPACPPPPPDY